MAAAAPGSAGYQGTRQWFRQVALEVQQFFTNITSTAASIATLTMTGPLIFNASNVFLSSEISADGTAQATAHGLGRTPIIAIAYFTLQTGGADAISAVTSDGTNCTVTATNTTKYRILAM